MKENYNLKRIKIEKESGIDVHGETETENRLADIIQQFKDFDRTLTLVERQLSLKIVNNSYC